MSHSIQFNAVIFRSTYSAYHITRCNEKRATHTHTHRNTFKNGKLKVWKMPFSVNKLNTKKENEKKTALENSSTIPHGWKDFWRIKMTSLNWDFSKEFFICVWVWAYRFPFIVRRYTQVIYIFYGNWKIESIRTA